MLDKNLLQHWRDYQQNKRKKKLDEIAANNVFHCLFDGFAVTLTFNEENIVVRRTGLRRHSIRRADINSYSLNEPALTIQVTFTDEAGMDPFEFHFQDFLTMQVATMALQKFSTESVNVPTPPSSNESDHLGEINEEVNQYKI
ncbi:hypothetical protein CBL_06925 [Carabus blaptoides fortunei]